jgi:hypothetical protein
MTLTPFLSCYDTFQINYRIGIGIFKYIVYSIGYIGYNGMEAYTKRLGELQQKILKHMFECTAETDNPNHIAKKLGIKQPTVYESVSLLMKDHYLKAEQKHKRGPKLLTLTDKGAAAAVLLGIDINEIRSYEKRRNSNLATEAFTYYGKIITTPEKHMLIFKKAMMYALKNNIFEVGRFRSLTPEEERGFSKYIMMEYMNSLGPTTNITSLKEFVDRYKLDKDFMKENLVRQKELIAALLKQLDE